jgi:hypothetical protein
MMRNETEATLKEIVRKVAIDSPVRFTVAGLRVEVGAAPDPAWPMPVPLPLEVALLQRHLYQNFYSATGAPPETAVDFAASVPPFLAALQAANTTVDRLDPGWRMVQALPAGAIAVHKQGLTRTALPGEFLNHETSGQPLGPGARLSLFLPRESLRAQPGFYYAFGQTPGSDPGTEGLFRIYWNISPEGAPALVRSLTAHLNRFQVPFRFKCGVSPLLYARRDPAVLFVETRFLDIVGKLLPRIYREVVSWLRPEGLPFAKPLAPGVGLAEDPASGESFGTSRCRVIAEGLWEAYSGGLEAVSDRLAVVLSHFRAAGFDLEAPFLNPGSVDCYHFQLAEAS